MYGQVNGKVIVRETKTGNSYNFQIVKNRRNPMSGRSENIIVWNFGTVKNTEIAAKANGFWKQVDSVIEQLVDSGKIDGNCRSEIRYRYEKFIPRPIAAVPSAAPVVAARRQINLGVAERVNNKFKGLI